jgi:hypothetical protein
VLLKKTKITPFKELLWKIKIQQRKEMLTMNNRIPRVKKSGHLLPVLPLIPQKTTKMEEEKGRFIALYRRKHMTIVLGWGQDQEGL